VNAVAERACRKLLESARSLRCTTTYDIARNPIARIGLTLESQDDMLCFQRAGGQSNF
jgi:hypothetical protein